MADLIITNPTDDSVLEVINTDDQAEMMPELHQALLKVIEAAKVGRRWINISVSDGDDSYIEQLTIAICED